MSPNPRLTFDTNVLVSAALFSDSTPAQAAFWALRQGAILISQALVQQLDDVLRRPRFERYLSLEDRELFLSTLIRRA